MFAEPIADWLGEMPADELATRLTGGVTVQELPDEIRSAIGPALQSTNFVLAPLPNQLFTRDPSAWLYGGVSLNPMFWPARQLETLNVEAIYRFHPRFRDAGFPIWFGGADHDWGSARLEGGDMMPAGRRRRPHRDGRAEHGPCRSASSRENMFEAGAARLVIGAQMPRERAAMHLDTVFTFCDRNIVTLYEPVVSQIRPILFRPGGPAGVQAEVSERSFLDELKEALGITRPEARHDRAATSSRPSATSGTTATTSSPSSPASWSPMSATRRRTRSWPRQVSRCSPSPGRSSAADAAAATA